jgi:hypothetical protein
MTLPLTVDGLYESARRYSRMTLDTHAKGRHHLVALYAGTALEHLAKACLAKRSPALVADFKGESSFRSVLLLLEIATKSEQPAGDPAASLSGSLHDLRTVGLRGALERMRFFIASAAKWEDLMSLAAMRDGTVHAAADDEVAMKLIVAFVQHANSLVADLHRDHDQFWGSRLSVVNALLTRARDRVTYIVRIKLAAAKANFEQYRQPLVLEAVRQAVTARPLGVNQAFAACPVCSSQGIATGFCDPAAGAWHDQSSKPPDPSVGVDFTAESFACLVCGLRLNSSSEIEAAGMQRSWLVNTDRISEFAASGEADILSI